MFSKSALLASGLLAAATLVRAQGTATIINSCSYPVYLWVADSPEYPEMQTIPPGGSHSEGYKTNPDGGGVSMKVAKVPNDGSGTDITQFEYTLDGMLWYDLSAINGNPFYAEGQSLHSNNPGCQSVKCKPSGSCNSAYYEPDDNAATHACDPSSDTTLHLCTLGAYHGANADADFVESGGNDSHHHKHHHHHKHGHKKQIGAPAPAPPPAATTMVVVTTTQVVKREADPTPVADNHLGARHAHNFHMQHRHGLSH